MFIDPFALILHIDDRQCLELSRNASRLMLEFRTSVFLCCLLFIIGSEWTLSDGVSAAISYTYASINDLT